MSFWLRTVNSVLNQLDDTVETVAEEVPDVVTSAAARILRTTQVDSNSGSEDGDDEVNDEVDGEFNNEEYIESSSEKDNDDNEESVPYSDDDFVDEFLDDIEAFGDDRETLDEPIKERQELENEKQYSAHPLTERNLVPVSQESVTKDGTKSSIDELSHVITPHMNSDESFDKKDLLDSNETLEENNNNSQMLEDLEIKEAYSSQDIRSSSPTVTDTPMEVKVDNESNTETVKQRTTSVEPTPSEVQSDFVSTISKNDTVATTNLISTQVTPSPEEFIRKEAPTSLGSVSVERLNATPSSSRLKQDSKDAANTIKTLKVTLANAQAEILKLQKHNTVLEQQLIVARMEIEGHLDELSRAATSMEAERAEFKLEREEIFEENEDEIQKIRAEYERKLSEQKEMYEQEISALQATLERERESRNFEFGENTAELENALVREKVALEKILTLHSEKSTLESNLTKLELHHDSLQKQVSALLETSKMSSVRQDEAERKLDEAVTSHKRQLQQRLNREGELERTVAELSAALNAAQQEIASMNAGKRSTLTDDTEDEKQRNIMYKEHYEAALEELDMVKVQMSLTTARCDALQKELHDLSNERIKEAVTVQNQVHNYEEKILKLINTNNRLEADLREYNNSGVSPANLDASSKSNIQPSPSSLPMKPAHMTIISSAEARVRILTNDIEQAKRKINSLSDQLIRQQSLSEQFKSEVLALKGRLQAAIARAEAAEQLQQQQLMLNGKEEGMGVGSLDLVDIGASSDYSVRRRAKSGVRSRYNQLPTRSIRKAMGLRPATGMEKYLARTIDALDLWMLETGSILRHEPLVRLGFGLYLLLLHTWCFALLSFHAVQAERHELRPMPLLVGGSTHINKTA